ncbi:MAG: tRNA (guanosine(37)-N1)-methyltransferase TrmD [bacterium]
MIYDLLTLFPEMFDSFLGASILGKAIAQGTIRVRCHNIRDYASGRHRVTDDAPYGGGSGMVMKPEPIVRAVEAVQEMPGPRGRVVLLSPQGRPFSQEVAAELVGWERLLLVCGRYEGVDERVKLLCVDEEISIGDYVLTGGEAAALVVLDATARLVPGVLGDERSSLEESFSNGLLEYPHYTRPQDFKGCRVPDVLLSGDHRQVAAWRRRKSLEQTVLKRPDLLAKALLSDAERRYAQEVRKGSAEESAGARTGGKDLPEDGCDEPPGCPQTG